jgi:SAM-dependent methyltransferase
VFHARGLDLDPLAIELARERFPELEFTRASVFDPFARELIRESDLVVSSDVMEHVEDDRAFLAGILEAMSPGARLLVTVPAHPGLWSQHDVSLGHFRRYLPDTLRAVWAGQPVEEEFLSFFNSRLFPLARAERVATRLRGTTRGAHQTDLTLPPGPINRLLARVFSGEAGRLLRAYGGRGRAFRNGLSMLAVLRRVDVTDSKATAA